MIEKKVIALEVPFDSEESIKNNIGFEMRDSDKVYFYDIIPENQKDEVKDFLWGYLYEPQNKSEKKQLEFVNAGLSLYPNREEYWNYFIQNTKSSRNKKRLIKLHNIANAIYASKKNEKNKELQTQQQKTPVKTERNDISNYPNQKDLKNISKTKTITNTNAKSNKKS